MEQFLTLQNDRGGFRRLFGVTLGRILALPLWLRILFVLAGATFLVTSLILLARANERLLVEVPARGGTLVEGIIGRPRFINPVIAKSDSDRDMTALIYSGLLRATADGRYIPDLADTFVVSPNGLSYTFTLRPELFWHDGTQVTSADVAFTIEKIRDPSLAIKSPRRAAWEGITIETPDERTIIFTMKQPYAPFLENATTGIIPKHIWENVPNEEFDVTYYNLEPIGTGPYRIARIVRDEDKGLPLYYDLVAFKRFALGEPYITNLRVRFFGNNKELSRAYSDGTIDQMPTIDPSVADALVDGGGRIERSALPRTFAAYFNQNQQAVFLDPAVREALALAVNKGRIVEEVLSGYGSTADEPLPFIATGTPALDLGTSTSRIDAARAILEKAGWVPNAAGVYEKTDKKTKKVSLLEFSIAIPDVPELVHGAEILKSEWSALGAGVTVKTFDPSSFTTEVLLPRKYDVLFFGQITGRIPDPYAYWHSSQRNAPGLNVALYTNKDVDKLLEDARKELDDARRTDLFVRFMREIEEDTPAVFLYRPDFLYAMSKRVEGVSLGIMTTESERFLSAYEWYVESEKVWTWFANGDDAK